MKSIMRFVFIVVIFIFALSGVASAQNVLEKFTRGVINMSVSPLELFQGVGDAYKEYDDMAIALPMGLAKGSWYTLRRLGVGLYEVLTFAIPFPKGYAPIIEEPRYLEDRDITESSD
ncbi:MAG: exosortase system-associated protein, TIGR04073 family [Candidatus Omnitrophica bacterium]|nr:exosortase system-associated protein, TIGR04073 family [Candidatus Omnitrophota bacterium]